MVSLGMLLFAVASVMCGVSDGLTGLLNRESFLADLEQATQGLERYVVLGLRTLCLESLWVVTTHLAQVASS